MRSKWQPNPKLINLSNCGVSFNFFSKPFLTMSITRNSSFELLRLVLMLMIVIHHSIVHGLGLSALSESYNSELIIKPSQMLIACSIHAFCICAVNCFVLISGYFGIKTTLKKVLFLVISIFIYTLLFSVIPSAAAGELKKAIYNCLFLSHSKYWFVIDYLFLMIFTPMINLAFETLPKRKTDIIIIGLLFISCYFGWLWGHVANANGYTLLQFILMYSVGRRFKYSNISLSTSKSLGLYVACSLLAGIVMWYLWHLGFNSRAWQITLYNNPLIICSAIGLFLLFKNFDIHSGIINTVAKGAFGIYLFQSSVIISQLQYGFINRIGTQEMYFGGGGFI